MKFQIIQSEIDIIKNKIIILQKEKAIFKKNKIVYIEKKLANEVELFIKDKIESKDMLKIFLEKVFAKKNERINLSLRNLANEYKERQD